MEIRDHAGKLVVTSRENVAKAASTEGLYDASGKFIGSFGPNTTRDANGLLLCIGRSAATLLGTK
jgi:hypothetical protein